MTDARTAGACRLIRTASRSAYQSYRPNRTAPSFRFDVKSISHTRTGYHSQFLQTGQVMFIFITAIVRMTGIAPWFDGISCHPVQPGRL